MIILGDGSELASVQEMDLESSKARCAAMRITAIARRAELLCNAVECETRLVETRGHRLRRAFAIVSYKSQCSVAHFPNEIFRLQRHMQEKLAISAAQGGQILMMNLCRLVRS